MTRGQGTTRTAGPPAKGSRRIGFIEAARGGPPTTPTLPGKKKDFLKHGPCSRRRRADQAARGACGWALLMAINSARRP